MSDKKCSNCGCEDFTPRSIYGPGVKERVIEFCDACGERKKIDKTPIELIKEERQRQVDKEGWTLEHDDEHTDQSLAMAAALYASPDDRLMAVRICEHCTSVDSISDPWPWWNENDSDRGPSRFKAWDKRKDHDRMRRLQIAGALIVAEMERLQRLGL